MQQGPLEGVLDRAEDRVRLTQLRLLDHGALFQDEEMTARRRVLYNDIIAGRIADGRTERGLTEEQEFERGSTRGYGIDDDLGL